MNIKIEFMTDSLTNKMECIEITSDTYPKSSYRGVRNKEVLKELVCEYIDYYVSNDDIGGKCNGTKKT